MMMTLRNGFTSMVTMHSWMFLSSFEKLRSILLEIKDNEYITSWDGGL